MKLLRNPQKITEIKWHLKNETNYKYTLQAKVPVCSS